MSLEGKDDGAKVAQIEVSSQEPKISENVKEDKGPIGNEAVAAKEDEKNKETKKVEDQNEKNSVTHGNEKKEIEKISVTDGNEKKIEKENEKIGVADGNEKKIGKENEENSVIGGDEKKIEKENEKNSVADGNEKNSVPHENEKKIEKETEKSGVADGHEKQSDKEKEKTIATDGNEKENVEENMKENVKENGKESVKEIENGELDANTEENTREIEKGECSTTSDEKDEENEAFSDLNLKDHEKKALADLRSKLEDAILNKKLFKKDKKQESHVENMREEKEETKKTEGENENENQNNDQKEEEKKQESSEDGGNVVVDKGKTKVEEDKKEVEKSEEGSKMETIDLVDKDIALLGVPLLPSKGDKATDVLLLKFLRAREFKANDALEMLRNTLQWRKDNKIDKIMEEDFGNDFDSVGYMRGVDREGHPVCYNVYGVFADDEMYNKAFGTDASRERFLRWRLQLLEKEIQKLDFSPGGISTLLQINDLKSTPGPSRKDIRLAMKRAVAILQDNYPEFVRRNIFINVPFWYYAFNALLSPFLTQRTKNKFVFCRPSRVTETLLKYMNVQEIPIAYGGLRRENDPDFSIQDPVFEANIKAGATDTIEIPAPEVGNTLMWDLTMVGWDVSYKEEFVPTDEGSYTIIVKKERRITWQDESIRNSFKNNEPGKVVITIENGMFKKKRVFYRYKTKD